MQEYSGEAVVLDKAPHGDADSRYALFTRRFGKLTAKAKSARKITSKLSPHLEPGNMVRTRLIEKNGLQVADALKISRLPIHISSLQSLNLLLADADPDPRIWHALTGQEFDWRNLLAILGWDPGEASCAICEKSPVGAFAAKSQEFFCSDCIGTASKIHKNEIIYI